MHLFEYGKNNSINVYKLKYNKQDLIDFREKLIDLNSIYSIEGRNFAVLKYLQNQIDINNDLVKSGLVISKEKDNLEVLYRYINGHFDFTHVFRMAILNEEFEIIEYLSNFLITEDEKNTALSPFNNYRLDNVIKLNDKLMLLQLILNSNWEYIEKKKLYDSSVWDLFKLEKMPNLDRKSINRLSEYGFINDNELFKINNSIDKTDKILKHIKTDI